MEVEIKHLKPGMVIMEDVIGKSGKPIVPKNTILSEIEIDFIKHFLIKTVKIDITKKEQLYLSNSAITEKNKDTMNEEVCTLLENEFREVVTQFEKLFSQWRNNLPVNMYEIRKLCIPLFERVKNESISTIVSLTNIAKENKLFYYKSVVISLLSIALAQKQRYEKKDWLQIGFAALLIDIGLTKTKLPYVTGKNDVRHPVLSYEMIKDEPTLTKNAKVAILQHHERLDGSGYPMKLLAEKIHPYAQIIAVADFFIHSVMLKELNSIEIFANESGKFAKNTVQILLNNVD